MGWLIDGADLLAEPDPGPTPWLAEGLIVDQAITAIVGRWKTTKSWAVLELAVSIATGTPAFGTVVIPEPGPVIYIIEESGRRALWRRLHAICGGRNIEPDALRGRLLLAANKRIMLDDPDWQKRLIETGLATQPRAIAFDPLARMKAATRKESDQSDMAPVIDFLRLLRDETGAAPLFVHHTGHQGEHMRGSSDLESAWESRLTFKRESDSGTITIHNEHRDEEEGPSVSYRLDWNAEARTMRLRPTLLPLAERIVEHLTTHGPMGAADLAKGIETRRSDVDRVLLELKQGGTTHRAPSGKRDAMGRPITAKVWHPSKKATLHLVPDAGRDGTTHPAAGSSPPPRPTPLGVDGGRDTAAGAKADAESSEPSDPQLPLDIE